MTRQAERGMQEARRCTGHAGKARTGTVPIGTDGEERDGIDRNRRLGKRVSIGNAVEYEVGPDQNRIELGQDVKMGK